MWFMNSNSCKCKVMRIGQSKRWPQCNHYLAGSKLQDNVSESDLTVDIVPNPSPESHIRRIAQETKCLLENVRITFKYTE